MSFAKFSNDFLAETFTLVDNMFIYEYLPYCDEKHIKVYLYGLYLCSNPEQNNSLETLSQKLDMTEAEILSAYSYFDDMGLVKIISRDPLEVKYLSFKRGMQPPKKYKSEKWNDFNIHLQQLFPERMLSPNEYNAYYEFLDSSKLELDAMLMIVQYCIDLKGMSVRYPYILAVARNWVADGCHTIDDVQERLEQYDSQSEMMRAILSAMKRKSGAELEEKQLLQKWTRSWGYELDAILAAIKTLKSKTFSKLDEALDEFYRMSIFTAEQIKDHAKQAEKLRELAISVNKTLGVFYESLDHEIEVYIVPWTAKGFEDDAILLIANYCFATSVRTLEGMNAVLSKFYTQGIISAKSIDEFFKAQIELDKIIKQIIENSGSSRAVNQKDREFYRTWTADWGFDDEFILHCATCAAGRTYPLPYINQLLSAYKEKGIFTVEEAKRNPIVKTTTQRETNFAERNYSQEELRSIVTSIDSLSDADI